MSNVLMRLCEGGWRAAREIRAAIDARGGLAIRLGRPGGRECRSDRSVTRSDIADRARNVARGAVVRNFVGRPVHAVRRMIVRLRNRGRAVAVDGRMSRHDRTR
jgi:hypothetical protein